jgi:anti-sigma regulatory factor (Ser/Thr protein kinase)
MARTAAEADPQLIALVVPSIPESVPVARLRVRAALGLHGLGEYADDVEIITSELVTNAVQHVRGNGGKAIGVTLMLAESPAAVTVVVSDSSPEKPVSPSHLEMIASRENPGWVQVVAGWGCCRAAVRVCGVAG